MEEGGAGKGKVKADGDGDWVLSLNEQTQKLEPHRVLALLDMGVKPVYRITTASGKSLKTTLTHPYLTRDGWKKLSQIKVGGEVVAAKGDVLATQGIERREMASLRGVKQARAHIRANKDGVKFLQFQANRKNNGVRGKKIILDDKFLGTKDMGSGDINDSYSSDRDIHSKFIQSRPKVSLGNFPAVFSAIDGRDEFRQREAGNQNSVFFALKDLNYRMASIFPVVTFNQGAGIKEIQHLLAFFSYPGNLFSQFTLNFTEALMNFLQGRNSFGKHGLGDVFIPGGYGESFTNEILNCNLIFNSGHNNLTSTLKDTITSLLSQVNLAIAQAEASQIKEELSRSDILWDKITSIEPLGPMPVYDIEVEATHNFVAQGIVAHNTYTNANAYCLSQIAKKKLLAQH